MRLLQYLQEAVVKQSNADVFLTKRAPIFMWSPKVGLLYAVYDKARTIWRLFHDGKEMDPMKWKYYDEYEESEFTEDYFRHLTLYAVYKDVDIWKDPTPTHSFIRGRIKPDGKEIYVHDLENRAYDTMMKKRFDYYVDKAIDAVYKYMGKYIR